MQCQGFEAPCDSQDAERYRMNTQYVDDDLNFMVLCPFCQERSEEYWNAMWEDYYSGIM